MLIDSESGIGLMSEHVTGELNVSWKLADWKMITVDGL
jgi:hypothetical protein